jgi:hypothetical protein
MNGIVRLSLSGLLMVMLAGCGGPPPDSQEAKEPPEPGSQKAEETVFDDMIQTQDRARAVEGVLMDSKKDLDTAIDHADETASE